MNEFKFDCPKCGQHILAVADWSGRRIECPSCESKITIPPAPKLPKKSARATQPISTPLPKPPDARLKVAAPTNTNKSTPATAAASTPTPAISLQKAKPKTTEPGLKTEASATAPPPADQLRIAVLTPAIKTEIVRAVRQRISEESKWLPGKVGEATAYAAKVVDGKDVLVEEKSPEATRFSLIGAFLLDFHLRKVTRTATGRTRLLDQEIPDAVREVLLEEMSDEEREKADGEEAKVDVTAISHAQCLAALQVLEDRYSQRMEQVRVEKAKKSIGNIRLSDLVKKLEIKASIDAEDVATALYHEVMDLRRRLERLENRNAGNK